MGLFTNNETTTTRSKLLPGYAKRSRKMSKQMNRTFKSQMNNPNDRLKEGWKMGAQAARQNEGFLKGAMGAGGDRADMWDDRSRGFLRKPSYSETNLADVASGKSMMSGPLYDVWRKKLDAELDRNTYDTLGAAGLDGSVGSANLGINMMQERGNMLNNAMLGYYTGERDRMTQANQIMDQAMATRRGQAMQAGGLANQTYAGLANLANQRTQNAASMASIGQARMDYPWKLASQNAQHQTGYGQGRNMSTQQTPGFLPNLASFGIAAMPYV